MLRTIPFQVHPAGKLPLIAAGLLADICNQAISTRGVAHIALSGGSTPRALFRLLATGEWLHELDWAHIHLWWVDERCVPPDDPDSNYGVAFHLLLQHLSISNVHRMHGEVPDPDAAAASYEAELRSVFQLSGRARPRFDLILLGMGEDGHTASLFPGTAALDAGAKLVTAGQAPVTPLARITLTLPVLNRTANAIFLVSGANKGPALQKVFSSDPTVPQLPAALVRPTNGQLLWLLDIEAAQAANLDS